MSPCKLGPKRRGLVRAKPPASPCGGRARVGRCGSVVALAQPRCRVPSRAILPDAWLGFRSDAGILSGRSVEPRRHLNRGILANCFAKGQLTPTGSPAARVVCLAIELELRQSQGKENRVGSGLRGGRFTASGVQRETKMKPQPDAPQSIGLDLRLCHTLEIKKTQTTLPRLVKRRENQGGFNSCEGGKKKWFCHGFALPFLTLMAPLLAGSGCGWAMGGPVLRRGSGLCPAEAAGPTGVGQARLEPLSAGRWPEGCCRVGFAG